MKIYLTLSSSLRKFGNETGVLELEMTAGSTISDALEKAAVPDGEAGIFILDGQRIFEDHILSEAENIHVYPVILGG
ncbi:MAG: hypothetical protein HGA49_06015 [Eubacteriaceae bacterium]|nr:hypothetical protein [Eubacteriaceae bacterium]